MAIRRNFSQKDRKIKEGYYDDPAQAGSNDPIREHEINYEEWVKFLSYYRYYIDEFAEVVLGINLFPFQRLILRAMARNQNSMLICSRGLGKSWLSAVFMICMCILYPGMKCGIVSGKGQQARNVIIQKIKGELIKNENLAREIFFPIRTGQDECYVSFKNGSEIRAVVLGMNQSGDSARSWRFNVVLVDEARLVKDDAISEVLIPMTKTNRENIINQKWMFTDRKIVEKGKVVYISSAYLKTCDLYRRFTHHYSEMIQGNPDYYVCSLDYKVGVNAGIFEEEDIIKEKDSPSMTIDKFIYEYTGVFVGSSSQSYFPYEITELSRNIDRCELNQAKKSVSQYIITHDVAISGNNKSDNAVTHVIKLKQRSGGTYYKEVVFTKTMNGASLPMQRDFLRDLIHIKFPNTIKLVIDARGTGAGLPALFYESWEYTEPSSGNKVEYPPIIVEDDPDGIELEGAIPLIHPVQATSQFNNEFYPYMKSCFEDGSLRLLKQSAEVDPLYKDGTYLAEEFSQHLETDILIQELSNIKQDFSDTGIMVYTRIVKTKKRDRATSLMYGLSYIHKLESANRQNYYKKSKKSYDNLLKYVNF